MKKLKKKIKKTSKKLSEIVVETAQKLEKLSIDDSVEVGLENVVEDGELYTTIQFTFPVCKVKLGK